jgi:hypothetical protein
MKATIKKEVTAWMEGIYSFLSGSVGTNSEGIVEAGLPVVSLFPPASSWEEEKEGNANYPDPYIHIIYKQDKELEEIPEHIWEEGVRYSAIKERQTIELELSLAEAISLINQLKKEVATLSGDNYTKEPFYIPITPKRK